MSHPNGEDNGTVSYSVKELLGEIKSSIDRLDVKITNKAGRDEVQALAAELQREVADLAVQLSTERGRVDQLENERRIEARANSAVSEWKRWLWPFLVAVALMVIGVLQLVKS